MENLQTNAVQALRFAVATHVVNWAIALSPISVLVAPVTKIVWVAVPFILLIGVSLLASARKFSVASGGLAIVSFINLTALSSLLLSEQTNFRTMSPAMWTFLITSLFLPVVSIFVASRLESPAEAKEEWQPIGAEVTA